MFLYNKLLSPDEQSNIVKQLKAAGFDINLTPIDYPESIMTSTIIFSPFTGDPKAVSKAEKILNQMGYSDISQSSFVYKNHWYTRNSIAVILLDDAIEKRQSESQQNLKHKKLVKDDQKSQRFISQACDKKITIIINDNNKFSISPTLKPDFVSVDDAGQWYFVSDDYLLLETYTKGAGYYFTVKSTDGKKRLTPMNNYLRFTKCVFEEATN